MSIESPSSITSLSPPFAVPETPKKKAKGENAPETPPSTNSTLSSYGFREITNEQTKKSKLKAESEPTPKKTRAVLPAELTASKVREDGHDCIKLDTQNIHDKVTARLVLSLDRFALTYSFHCKTTRGITHLNGAQSSCGGCHAAHAALSGKLYDNILEVVKAALCEKEFNQLAPSYQGYLKRRFELTEKDLQNLSSENQDDRISTFDKHASTLSGHEKKRSFIGTDAEFQRNVTFENRIASNHFDSFLESKLRKLEDELDEECRLGNKTPIEALVELQEAYRKTVEKAIQSLRTDLDNLEDLREAWNTLLERQKGLTPDTFASYLVAVDNYLAAHSVRFKKTKLEGTATLEALEWYLKDNQSPAVLKELQNNRNALYYKLNKRFLKAPEDSDKQFALAQSELEGRLTEACYQLDGLHNSPDDIKKMLKYGYGKKDAAGVVKTPDKSIIAETFNDLPRKGKENKKKASRKRDLTGDFLN